MTIQSKVNELSSIKNELKMLGKRGKLLRKRLKVLENEITDYLVEKDQPGMKYKGLAIIKEVVTKRHVKKKNDAKNDIISILNKNGVNNAEKVYIDLLDAKKGEPTETLKLKIKKYKKDV